MFARRSEGEELEPNILSHPQIFTTVRIASKTRIPFGLFPSSLTAAGNYTVSALRYRSSFSITLSIEAQGTVSG